MHRFYNFKIQQLQPVLHSMTTDKPMSSHFIIFIQNTLNRMLQTQHTPTLKTKDQDTAIRHKHASGFAQ